MRYVGEPASRSQAWRDHGGVCGSLVAARLRAVGRRRASQPQVHGRIGLWNPEGWPGLEVGWLLDRAYWGRGLATEGARAALNYAFTTLRADHVISVIHPENTRSIRVAERIGERFEREYDLEGSHTLIYGIRSSALAPADQLLQ